MPPSFFSRHHNDQSRPAKSASDDLHDIHENRRTPSTPGKSVKNQGGIRSSLRRLPSSLLNKLESPRRGPHGSQRDDSHPPVRLLHSTAIPSSFSGPPLPLKEDSKSKAKSTRKGLAGLFGRSTQPAVPPPTLTKFQLGSTIAPPSPARPIRSAPAEKQDRERSSMHFLKSIKSKSSLSGLSGFASLKPAQEKEKDNSREQSMRPSMGPDPFMRTGEGAEVVEHVDRPFAVSPSIRSSMRSETSATQRASMNSGKAFSSRTTVSAIASTKISETSSMALTSPTSITFPSTTQHAPLHRPSRMGVQPVNAASALVDLPTRTTSLGRTLNNLPKDTATSSLPKSATFALAPPLQLVEPELRNMKREKTKSSVFAFLKKNKSRKKADHVVASMSPPPVPSKPDTVSVPRKNVLIKPSPSERQLKDKLVDKPVTHNRPPALHITHPSVDTGLVSPPATGSTVGSVRFSIQQARYVEDITATHATSPVNRVSTASLFTGGLAAVKGEPAPQVAEPNDTTKAINALFAAKATVPKRKSLTGIFGLSMQTSFDRLKDMARNDGRRFKSLREEAEATMLEQGLGNVKASPPFKSRFGDKSLAQKSRRLSESPGIRRVASATDKLSTLISVFEFSPANTPPEAANQKGKTLPFKPSFESIKESTNASPTPIRHSQSALLSSKTSSSSLRPLTRVSPIKLGVRVAKPVSAWSDREPGNDTFGVTPPSGTQGGPKAVLVQRGKPDVFAPPTPVDVPQSVTPGPTLHTASAGTPVSPCPAPSSARDYDSETIGMRAGRLPVSDLRNEASYVFHPNADLPMELLRVVSPPTRWATSSAVDTQKLGLPDPPAAHRITPRRPPKVIPKVSLPPLPDSEGYQTPNGHVSRFAPHISLDIGQTPRMSMLSELLSADGYARNSFDFDGEYATLAIGSGRESFVHALETARPSSAFDFGFGGSLSPESDSRRVSGMFDDAEEGNTMNAANLALPPRARAGPSPRREPFMGNTAFQWHVQQARAVTPTAPAELVESAAPAVVDLNEEVVPRGHRRAVSAMTMSSMGDVIETGVAGEYTNYFEANFAQHLLGQANDQEEPSAGADQVATRASDALLRSTGSSARSHHRRNSSIFSVESIGIGLATISRDLPPPAMHNRRRSSQIMRHSGMSSASGSFGRIDWASHQRRTSTTSSRSSISVARLARPGLGERMFALDAGVQLASITGSPANELVGGPNAEEDGQASSPRAYARDTGDEADLLDLYTRSEDDDVKRLSNDSSVFAGPEPDHSFRLYGARPASTVSGSSTTNSSDESHISASRYATLHTRNALQSSPLRAQESHAETPYLEARGEDETMYFTPAETTSSSARGTGRSRPAWTGSLGMSRPAKPVSGNHRRRPPRLVFAAGSNTATPATPGLTSDSASERSSRMSVDTLGSFAAGHRRQKSSKGVIPQATIKEEPSHATLRPSDASNSVAEVMNTAEIRGKGSFQRDLDGQQALRAWVEWQKEAEEECKRMKRDYSDSEEVQAVMEGFVPPTSFEDIAAFLKQSAQHYQPLPSLPTARPVHNRQNSRSFTRLSPYGLPLPRAADPDAPKPKKMSIPTKYERTNSAGSSSTVGRGSLGLENPFAHSAATGTGQSTGIPPGAGGIFARFVTDLPKPRAATQRTNGSLPPHPLVRPDSIALTAQPRSAALPAESRPKLEVEKRVRVPSATRRQNLGWGKRKEVDAVQEGRAVPDLPGPVRAAVMRLEESARQKREAEKELAKKRRPLADLPKKDLHQKASSKINGKGKERDAAGGAHHDKENAVAKKVSHSKLKSKKAPETAGYHAQGLRV